MDTRFETNNKTLFWFTNGIVRTEVCDDAPDMERLLMEIVEHRLVEACNWEMDDNIMITSTFAVLVVGITSCKD